MRIIIREEYCTGCGVCVSMCPDFFEFDRSGKAKVSNVNLPETAEHDCRQTAQMCPAEAIELLNVA